MCLNKNVVQSPLVIVDLSVCQDLSTKKSNSTITGEIHAKIDNWSAKSVHYNEKFHYYGVHYYERRLYYYIQRLLVPFSVGKAVFNC